MEASNAYHLVFVKFRVCLIYPMIYLLFYSYEITFYTFIRFMVEFLS